MEQKAPSPVSPDGGAACRNNDRTIETTMKTYVRRIKTQAPGGPSKGGYDTKTTSRGYRCAAPNPYQVGKRPAHARLFSPNSAQPKAKRASGIEVRYERVPYLRNPIVKTVRGVMNIKLSVKHWLKLWKMADENRATHPLQAVLKLSMEGRLS